MIRLDSGIRQRFAWLLGTLTAWTILWASLGAHQAILTGSHPHPFLPEATLKGSILKAIVGWALGAWMAMLAMGLLWGLLVFAAWMVQRKGDFSNKALSFGAGLWQASGIILIVHGLLYWEVPTALESLPLLTHLPMGFVILGMLVTGVYGLGRGFRVSHCWGDWGRLATGIVLVALLLQLPHDLFRRSMPRPPKLDPGASRVLVYSIDGCRKDVLEKVAPALGSPQGVTPVVAVPATRAAWNLLLGGPPQSLTQAFVIPFESEWAEASPARLLEETSAKGLSTCFLIDDSSTLSFGLTRAKFTEVMEPRGGWTHYFAVGAGACWPVYSWLENYLSPVETTNPWSDFSAYNRDVERALSCHRLVFSHTCQLHAPLYAKRQEVQALRPWKWLFHAAYAYQSYQTLAQAQESQVDRQDGRSNPKNSYRLRLQRIMGITQPLLNQWTRRFPALSGVLTADHGEAFPPIITTDGTLRNYLTGIHGFTLEPDTVLIPMHPFGRTQTQDLRPGSFSWYDLRQCLRDWTGNPAELNLKQIAPEGWLLSFPTIQATHVRDTSQEAASSAGVTPGTLARYTVLDPNGIWFMSNPPPALQHPTRSHALVSGNGMVTFNPLGQGTWSREAWTGYERSRVDLVTTEAMEKEVAAFPGKRPDAVFPLIPSPGRP